MSGKTQYLLLYNALSASLWAILLARLLLLIPFYGPAHIYSHIGSYARWTQTLAIAEILHSALGLVRAPLLTTAMQVASRLLLVHGIVAPFPNTAGENNPFYASMLLAWSVTEVVRYSFFARALSQPQQSNTKPNTQEHTEAQAKSSWSTGTGAALTWLRYNTFFVLYPIGIGSEVASIVRAMGAMKASARGTLGFSGVGLYGLAWWACVAVLALYVPGAWVLYTYMMAQRRKVFGSGRTAAIGTGEPAGRVKKMA